MAKSDMHLITFKIICFAMEKMHLLKRDYLTKSEWDYVTQLAIDNYPEYDWEVTEYILSPRRMPDLTMPKC